MKNYILILFLLSSFIAFAQPQTQNQGSATTLITNRGAYQVDSVLGIPYRDTVAWMDRWGNLTIRPQDNKLYYRSGGFWKAVASNTPGSTGAITWGDTLSLVATKKNLKDTAAALRSAINLREKLSSRVTSLTPASDTTYPTTKAVTDYLSGNITPQAFYAYDRTIDSIDVYGTTTKYIKLYRHALPALVDSFTDNNNIYVPGWGLLLTGQTFRVDTALVPSKHYLDSLASTFYYYAFYPLHIDNDGPNKIITHYSSGVAPGTYTKVTVDVYGHTTEGAALAAGDIPDISQSQVLGLVDTINGINVNSITFTGTTTKTAKITRGNGSWIQGNFTDLDNQSLALSASDSLSISGGNSIHLPYLRSLPGGTFQSFTGTVTNSITLSNTPAASSGIFVTMNNAWLDPADWSRTGATINLSFTTATTDLITVYYSH